MGGGRLERAVPPGPLQRGQTLLFGGAVLGRHLHLTMEIDAMDEQKGVIDMRVMLPFGMVNHEHMTVASLSNGSCRVQFGWDFTFPPGWRSWLWNITRKNLALS